MKAVFLGFCLSAVTAVVVGALMALGSFLGFDSPWCPLFWPGYAYGLVGFALLYPAEHIPCVISFFAWLVPEGGTLGVFTAILLFSFIGWGCLLSCFLYYKHNWLAPNSYVDTLE